MNKLTKIGASALCGSLAAISSANAGDLTVTGGVDMSWVSMEDEVTGNPIGIGSNLTFKGSGELDNGWTVDLSVAHKNANAYSNTNVTVGVPGLGDFRISQGVSGGGICRMDDLTPNVWEEAWGTGLATVVDLVAGASGGAGIEWTPEMTPDGLTARVFQHELDHLDGILFIDRIGELSRMRALDKARKIQKFRARGKPMKPKSRFTL